MWQLRDKQNPAISLVPPKKISNAKKIDYSSQTLSRFVSGVWARDYTMATLSTAKLWKCTCCGAHSYYSKPLMSLEDVEELLQHVEIV